MRARSTLSSAADLSLAIVRTVLLLLVMVSLLASSLKAVAHVDDAAAAPSHAAVHVGGDADAPAGNDHPGTQKHCDLCSHGFCHLAVVVPAGRIESVYGVVLAEGPALPRPASRPDLQDRPPK